MTTIAYDGSTLVADRKMTLNDKISTGCTKIFKLENNDCFQAIGFSGNIDAIYKIIAKLEDNCYEFERAKDDFSALLIDHAGTPWILESEGEVQELTIPWAIGSGGDFARGAMEAGCNAREAVAIATALDIRTGLGYDEITITQN